MNDPEAELRQIRQLVDAEDHETTYKAVERTLDAAWEESEQNTVHVLISHAHPEGGDGARKFWEWWRANRKGWLGPRRAAGVWLAQELARAAEGAK